jgi:hypothetical protein
MTILAALLTVALTAAFVTGCTAHRVMRIDERIVLVPASAAPAGPLGPVARGLQGTVIDIKRADYEATLLTPEGKSATVKLPPITTGLLREGDVIAIDTPVGPPAR